MIGQTTFIKKSRKSKNMKYIIWFKKKGLKVRDEVLMNGIYLVDEYEVTDDSEKVIVTFNAPGQDKDLIIKRAFESGSCMCLMKD
tara:strand:- start:64 stop:318 length:255 start_codon:yes stop_codon:yes gene_type:complete